MKIITKVVLVLFCVSLLAPISTVTAQETGNQKETDTVPDYIPLETNIGGLEEFTSTTENTENITQTEYVNVVLYYNQVGHNNPLNLSAEQQDAYDTYTQDAQDEFGLSPQQIITYNQQLQDQENRPTQTPTEGGQGDSNRQTENTQDTFPDTTLFSTNSITLNAIEVDEEARTTTLYITSRGTNSYIWFTPEDSPKPNYDSGTLDDGQHKIVLDKMPTDLGIGFNGVYATFNPKPTIIDNYFYGNVSWGDIAISVVSAVISGTLAIFRKYAKKERTGKSYMYSLLTQKEQDYTTKNKGES